MQFPEKAKNVVLILAFVWILRRFFFTGFCAARNRGQNMVE
jgi:hypothetical protein